MKDFDFRTIHNVLDIIDNELSETQSFHGIKLFSQLKQRISKSKDLLKKVIFRRYREIGYVSSLLLLLLLLLFLLDFFLLHP
jgi:hypothetical protein